MFERSNIKHDHVQTEDNSLKGLSLQVLEKNNGD